jgi:hypothetical protein
MAKRKEQHFVNMNAGVEVVVLHAKTLGFHMVPLILYGHMCCDMWPLSLHYDTHVVYSMTTKVVLYDHRGCSICPQGLHNTT